MVENVNAVAGSAIDLQDYAIPAEEPPSGQLGKDAFLKLLVAQLKYQDPLEPSTSEEFIATTAQFTVVEKLDELTKQGANTALVNSLTTASTLVGREVTANRNGLPVTAVVQQSRIVSGAVVLDTDQGSIQLNEIVSVGPAPAVAVTGPPVAATSAAPESGGAAVADPAPPSTASPNLTADTSAFPTVTPAPIEAAGRSSEAPVTLVAPTVQTEQEAVPERAPEPVAEPAPEPELAPELVSELTPEPAPEPAAEPAPEPAPQPVSELAPGPVTRPESEPDIEPDAGTAEAATGTVGSETLDPVGAAPLDAVAVAPAVEAEQIPVPDQAGGPPTQAVSSDTPAAVENADHVESDPFNPFDTA